MEEKKYVDQLPLAERVRLFRAGRLPGQVVKFCTPTNQLVTDLWREREQMIEVLREALIALTDLPDKTRAPFIRRAKANIALFLEKAKQR